MTNDLRDRLRRRKAAFNDWLAYRGFDVRRPTFVLFAFAAGVNQANVLAYFYPRRNNYKLVPAIPPHSMKRSDALRADTLAFRQIMLHNFDRQILRLFVR